MQIVSNSTAEVDNEGVTSPQWEGYIHEVCKCEKLEHLCNYKSDLEGHAYFLISQIRRDDILVQFAEVFHSSYTNWEADVMFTFGRLVP